MFVSCTWKLGSLWFNKETRNESFHNLRTTGPPNVEINIRHLSSKMSKVVFNNRLGVVYSREELISKQTCSYVTHIYKACINVSVIFCTCPAFINVIANTLQFVHPVSKDVSALLFLLQSLKCRRHSANVYNSKRIGKPWVGILQCNWYKRLTFTSLVSFDSCLMAHKHHWSSGPTLGVNAVQRLPRRACVVKMLCICIRRSTSQLLNFDGRYKRRTARAMPRHSFFLTDLEEIISQACGFRNYCTRPVRFTRKSSSKSNQNSYRKSTKPRWHSDNYRSAMHSC